MEQMTKEQEIIIEHIKNKFNGQTIFQPRDLREIADANNIDHKHVTSLLRKMPKVSRGMYDFSIVVHINDVKENKMPATNAKVESVPQETVTNVTQFVSASEDVFVPAVDKFYVRWGHTKDVEQIIKSNMFYPVFVTGLSGNGKTTMIEQACAKIKKKYIRVQITPETDEDDLLGGFRLVNGQTVFAEGPVIRAMKSGALLLLDEIDRGSNRIMCLQSVLEGKPVLIKKTGEVVEPAFGFNVFATANTKGKGSEDGRFIAANILDEAFLERFNITMEQPYPTFATERKIVLKHMDKYGNKDEEFAEKLVTWSEAIRKTFLDGGVDEIISTRRLCHIAQTFSIFNNRMKAINLCIARFDDDTKTAFSDLYTKIDAGVYNVEPKVEDDIYKSDEISF